MRRLLALVVLVVVACTAFAAAKRPKFIKVMKFVPRHGKLLVSVTSSVTIRFSKPIDATTVSPQTLYLRLVSGKHVPATYSQQRGGREVVLAPQTLLLPGADYELVVTTAVLSTKGLGLRRERHADFFTDPRSTSTEILRPDQFAVLDAQMTEARALHTATLLDDGTVLFAAGQVDAAAYAVSGDVYVPETGTFHSVGSALWAPRAGHVAVRFANDVLLVGGSDVAGALATTERFVTATSTFEPGPPLIQSRDYVAAVTLKDGRVFVTGGLFYDIAGAHYRPTAEIYDPAAGSFRFTASPPIARRAGHTATLLKDGTVLLVGGESGVAPTAEVFDPATETFTTLASAPLYNRQLHTATVLEPTDLVLFADGGATLLQVFEPATGVFHPAGGSSSVRRTGATASLLPNGDVLIAGGVEDRGDQGRIALDTMDLYRRSLGDYGGVLRTTVAFDEPRLGHTATTLGDGSVILAGGFGTSSPENLKTAIVFTPDPPSAKK